MGQLQYIYNSAAGPRIAIDNINGYTGMTRFEVKFSLQNNPSVNPLYLNFPFYEGSVTLGSSTINFNGLSAAYVQDQIYTIGCGNGTKYINETVSPFTSQQRSDTYHMWFNANAGGRVLMHIYYLKFFDANDNVILDFVPFDDNGTIGLKDINENLFYTNWSGASGSWIAGPPYTPPTPPTPSSDSKIYLGSTNLGTWKIRLGANDVSAIYLGTSLIYPPQTPLYQNVVCFTALQANVDIAYTHPDDLGFTPKFYASTDGVNFTQMTKQVPVTLSNIGDKLYIYGDNQYLCNQTDISKYAYFLISGDVTVGGDLTTLLDVNGLTTLPDRAFVQTLRSGHIISAADLTVNVTSVGKYGLYGLFKDCVNLTDGIAALPATTLGEYCYANMYYGCEKLTTTPTTLPAATLSDSCYYQMFAFCKRIVTAPSLPAINLSIGCYGFMFDNCTGLQNAPATLPATTTVTDCYRGMFNNCDSLHTAPEIYTTNFVVAHCGGMFESCSNLDSVTVRATSWDNSGSSTWLGNVPSGGTFTKPAATVIPTGSDGIPTGWTVVNV